MHCPACGARLPLEAKACPNCGTLTPAYYAGSGASPNDPTQEAAPGSSFDPMVAPTLPSTQYGSNPQGVSLQSPYDVNPYQVVPPPPPPRKVSPVMVGILTAVVLLVVGASVGFVFLRNHQISMNQAPASVTVSAQNSNPYGGTLIASDAMSGPGSAFGWETGNDILGDQCNFRDKAYHVVGICDSNGIMNGNASISKKFAFEIHLNAGKNCGELHFYFQSQSASVSVDICQNGQYQLRGNPEVDGTAAAMHTGAGQFNIIGIVADDTHLALYINYVLVATSASAYTGLFGLKLDGWGANGASSLLGEVVYTDARLWSL